MVNIAQVVDAIVEKLREISELVTEMGANPDRIYAYHDHYPKRTSLAQAIYQMPAPSVAQMSLFLNVVLKLPPSKSMPQPSV